MKPMLDSGDLHVFSAYAQLLQSVPPHSRTAQRLPLPSGRSITRNHTNFVAIQVKPFAREMRCAIEEDRKPDVEIYPGIDVDVPAKLTDRRTKPEGIHRSVHAAFDADANCVVVSREYAEMSLANRSVVGDALRRVFASTNS